MNRRRILKSLLACAVVPLLPRAARPDPPHGGRVLTNRRGDTLITWESRRRIGGEWEGAELYVVEFCDANGEVLRRVYTTAGGGA